MVIPTKEKYLIWWLTFSEFYSIISMVWQGGVKKIKEQEK